MFRILILITTMSLAAVACDENPNANKDAEGPVTNVLDTVPPPADEAKGMDNRPGYNTVQDESELEKKIPYPSGDFNVPPQGAVFKADAYGVDFAPNRYSFRYILPEGLEEDEGSPLIVSQPPLFSSSCVSKEDKLACSNSELSEYLESLPFTSAEGELVYAVAILGEKGELESVKQTQYVTGQPCTGCEQLVRQALEQMPAWEPATYDGEAVKAQVVIPMRLDTDA